ncbi:TolC family outer membrane protein [Nitrosomonas halophila]|uniref:Outer membrane protein, protease secretion system n=1 Tax=Nitrosomonas halophila TaxID=44576 RepID=A0A1H3EF71_9PROT|nr:TolC family outer membrane protein [Nitrosomonas halophila]SDX77382.1 outer membrane protein, protease secretion system [Nitrosomonas halophila]
MRRQVVKLKVVLALLWQFSQAQAMGLLEAYEEALRNDPVFRSAVHENEAGQQSAEIGLSGLLPTLSITHAHGINRGTISQGGISEPLDFNNEVTTLALRQPLLNLEAVAGYRQGIAEANSSQARFAGHTHLLIVRLAEAYFNALLAQDRLALANAQRDALAELKLVNEHMLMRGEGTKTDVLETRSRYALAQAEVIEAQDEWEAARLALATLTGQPVTQLDSLGEAFRAQPIHPADYESWREMALVRNAELVTQRYMVDSSKQEVEKSRSGHAPRVELVASLSRNNSASFVTADRNARLASVGVEVNIPLYAGGRVNAVTSQARANQARTEADLDAMTDQVLLELRRQYQLLQSSILRIESLEIAVESAQLLVEATEKSIRGGVRINLDLLDAQRQLFSAQVDLADARYNYLLAYLRLRYAAGTLQLDDLRSISGYFVASK